MLKPFLSRYKYLIIFPNIFYEAKLFVTLIVVSVFCLSCLDTSLFSGEKGHKKKLVSFYVSTTGSNSTGDGTLSKPWKTLEHARSQVRNHLSSNVAEIQVKFLDGTYYFDNTVIFTGDDSLDNGMVIYKSASGGSKNVHWIGGVPVTGWMSSGSCQDGSVWQAAIPGNVPALQLFERRGNQYIRKTRARWPNTGFETSEGSGGNQWTLIREDNGGTGNSNFPQISGAGPDQTICAESECGGPGCSACTDCDVCSSTFNADLTYWSFKRWFLNRSPIKKIEYSSLTDDLIYLSNDANQLLSKKGHNDFALEAREMLDQPGEFFAKGNRVYYCSASDPNNTTMLVPTVERLVQFKGTAGNWVSDIAIEGITMSLSSAVRRKFVERDGRYGDFNLPQVENRVGLIDVSGYAQRIKVRRSVIQGAGLNGISLLDSVRKVEISNNVIRNIGYNGILVMGKSLKETDPDAVEQVNYTNSNDIENNDIYGVGKRIDHAGGIFLNQAGHNRIVHNDIHDSGRYGVVLKGTIFRKIMLKNKHSATGPVACVDACAPSDGTMCKFLLDKCSCSDGKSCRSASFPKSSGPGDPEGNLDKQTSLKRGILNGNAVTADNVWDFATDRNNYIGYNSLYDVLKRSYDCGVISVKGGGRNNVVDGNRIFRSKASSHVSQGVYLDDGARYWTIKNNVVFKIGMDYNGNALTPGVDFAFPMQIKNEFNTIVNNIIHAGYYNSVGIMTMNFPINMVHDFVFQNNIVYRDGRSSATQPHYSQLDYKYMVGFNRQVDTSKHVKMHNNNLYYDTNVSDGPWMYHQPLIAGSNQPVHYTAGGNCSSGTTVKCWQDLKYDGGNMFDSNSLFTNPSFISASTDDYRLNANSSAYSIGFKDIDQTAGKRGSLVSYFPFDSSESTQIDYVDGYTSDTQYNDNWTSSGKYQGARVFNGTDAYRDFSSTVGKLPSGSEPRTVAFWFNTTETGNKPVFWYGTNSGNGKRFGVNVSKDTIAVAFNGHTWGKKRLSLSGWHHVAVVYPKNRSASKYVLIYLDGIPLTGLTNIVGSSITVKTSTDTAQSKWELGRFTASNYWNGMIDDLRVYSGALNYTTQPGQTSEISDLYDGILFEDDFEDKSILRKWLRETNSYNVNVNNSTIGSCNSNNGSSAVSMCLGKSGTSEKEEYYVRSLGQQDSWGSYTVISNIKPVNDSSGVIQFILRSAWDRGEVNGYMFEYDCSLGKMRIFKNVSGKRTMLTFKENFYPWSSNVYQKVKVQVKGEKVRMCINDQCISMDGQTDIVRGGMTIRARRMRWLLDKVKVKMVSN